MSSNVLVCASSTFKGRRLLNASLHSCTCLQHLSCSGAHQHRQHASLLWTCKSIDTHTILIRRLAGLMIMSAKTGHTLCTKASISHTFLDKEAVSKSTTSNMPVDLTCVSELSHSRQTASAWQANICYCVLKLEFHFEGGTFTWLVKRCMP